MAISNKKAIESAETIVAYCTDALLNGGEDAAVKITERGWAGHFICADRCRFRRNTLLELGDERWVVSTVGAFYNSQDKLDTIGLGRYYETMAFVAKYQEPYWEADVNRQIEFNSPWAIDHCDWDSDAEAQEMHETVVNELKNRLIADRAAIKSEEVKIK